MTRKFFGTDGIRGRANNPTARVRFASLRAVTWTLWFGDPLSLIPSAGHESPEKPERQSRQKDPAHRMDASGAIELLHHAHRVLGRCLGLLE